MIINGQLYDVEPAVEAYINRLEKDWCERNTEIAKLKAENAQLEEKWQKATGVIAMYPSANEIEKHGHWIELDDINDGYFKCSHCEKQSEVPTCMGEPIYEYCPRCGAKMNGGADNETDKCKCAFVAGIYYNGRL